MLAERSAAEKVLGSITDRQREVLDLVLQHRTSKEIARELGIAPNTVDQRINAVRDRLGARDRAETARLYVQLNGVCGKTTYGPAVVASPAVERVFDRQDGEIEPMFVLNDSAFGAAGDWEHIGQLVIPRARITDSKLWRLVAIVGIALGVVVIGTTMLAVMQSLGTML